MDVQADQAGSDPYGTVAAGRPGAGQGRLFSESVDTATSYDDTDQLPIVPRGHYDRSAGTRALRVAVVIAALAVLAGAVALGLVSSGVLKSSSTPPSRSATNRSTSTTTPVRAAKLLTQTATGAGTATYRIPVPAYEVTVTTTTGRSWVSIQATGQHPVYAGILNPGSTQRELLLGPGEVDIGAGGTTVTITSGKKSQTLTPPSAPFSYQFTASS